MRVAIHRVRREYRALLRAEIAETVEGPEAVDDEIRRLLDVLSIRRRWRIACNGAEHFPYQELGVHHDAGVLAPTREAVHLPLLRCSQCGAELGPANMAQGMCARCLLERALEPGPEDGLAVDDSYGSYRPVRLLGEGGMGLVYLAEQMEPLRRTVALKVLKAGMDAREVLRRFDQERQTLASLDHPNIVAIYDAGVSVLGRPYFVMELVDGEPVTDYCDRFRLTTVQRVQLFEEVCAAVEYANQKGVIHRDLKPSNVLVAETEGRPHVKIIDFGIAWAAERDWLARTALTAPGQTIGTPEYMSPEQAGGSAAVDRRTDVYALGVLLYELLVGALPFEAAELRRAGWLETLRIIREEEPPQPTRKLTGMGDRAVHVARRRQTDPGALRRDLAGDVDLILLKALEKEPKRRYDSARSFAEDLGRYLEHQPVHATQGGWWYRTRKFTRRRRALLAGAVFAAACVGFALASWLVSHHRTAGAPLNPISFTSMPGSQLGPTFSPDGRKVVYTWDGPDGAAWHLYISDSAGADPRQITFGAMDDVSPSWSPDGRQIAFIRGTAEKQGRVMSLDVASGREREIARLRSGYLPTTRTLDWSPDGKWMVVLDHAPGMAQNGLQLLSLETGERRVLTQPPKGVEDMQPAFSRDGRHIAFTRDSGAAIEIWLQNVTSGMRAEGPAKRMGNGAMAFWSPTGDLWFRRYYNQHPMLWRFPAGAANPEHFEILGTDIMSANMSRDGRRVVFARSVSDLDIWRYRVSATGSLTGPEPFAYSTVDDSAPTFSPDGARVAFVSTRSGVSQVWVADSSGSNPKRVSWGVETNAPHWTADGKRLLCNCKLAPGKWEREAIEVATGHATPIPGQPQIQSVSADGKWYFGFPSGGKKARAWKFPAAGSGPAVPLTKGRADRLELDPTGEWLYFAGKPIDGKLCPLLRVPVAGGAEEVVLPEMSLFAITRKGVYFILPKPDRRRYSLNFLANGSHVAQQMLELEKRPYGRMAVSPDGRTLLIDVWARDGTNLMLAELAR